MNNLHQVARMLATLGPIGHLPARGTIASLVALGALYISAPYVTPCLLPSIMISIVGFSLIAIHYALFSFKTSDPQEIVLDEVAGFMFSMYLFPKTIIWLCLGFCVFRFFDIVKPLGIKRVEQLPGAVGVVLDDLLAGLYTQATLLGGAIVYALWLGQ